MFSILWQSFAFAQTAAPAAAPQQPGTFEAVVLPMLFVFGVMYFFMLRPQAKRQKEHQKLLSGLKRGDEVITSSGILGKIDGLTDSFVTLEVAPGVKIRVLRTQIAMSGKPADMAKNNEKTAPAQS